MLSRSRQSVPTRPVAVDTTSYNYSSDDSSNKNVPFTFNLAYNALHDDPWKLLGLYSIYKLVLASILIFANASALAPLEAKGFDPELFDLAINMYLFIAIINALAVYLQHPDFEVQLYTNILVDVIILMILIYSSNSLSNSFALLMIIPLFSINLFRPGQYSLLIAALSVIGILTITIIHSSSSESVKDSNDIIQTGLVCLFLLCCAWFASIWAKRANDAAALVKRRESDIASLSQLNRSILDELQSGILVVEQSGAIKHINSTAWKILGKPDNWRSQPVSQFAPELNKHLQIWLNNICPKVISCDIRHQHSMELRTRFTQLGTKDKAMTLINIEDMRELRERLQDAKLASLGQLTANIAHEIRNPLGAISHSAQLLSESENLDKIDQRMVQIIQSNSNRMNMTIESVLNLSRKKNPKQDRILLRQWLREFLDDFIMQTKLESEQVKLYVSPPECTVNFDPAHLNQVLWNLCRNALKYAKPSEPGKLKLEVQAGLPDHSRDVILNVIDNGDGINEEKQKHLFEPFFTTSDSGTGLGLFMSRELCLSNGCSLDYHPVPSGGSCFRLVFTTQ